MAAAREVGVARTTGHNWSRGYKIYRRGQVTGFVPALERLAVRQISARYLSQDERIEIADLRSAGLGIRRIADQLGRAPSTISRELRRNATATSYRPFEAHRRATARRARSGRRRIEISGELRQLVAEFLAQRWSPQQISRQLRLRFPGRPAMWLCHESIYQAIYQPGDRSQAGHWEGDLIIGKDQGSAIGTLVERQTRMVRLLHMPYRDSDTLHHALKTRLADLPPVLLRSVTWDQGTGMARHLTIARSLGARVYFCDSHSPWQRGSHPTICSPSRTSSTTGPSKSSATGPPRSSSPRC
jgi:transposase, IS30 family